MIATEIQPYNCQKQWLIKSDSGGAYSVKLNTAKPQIHGLSCNCPAWRFQSRGLQHRTCKHCQHIAANGMTLRNTIEAMQ